MALGNGNASSSSEASAAEQYTQETDEEVFSDMSSDFEDDVPKAFGPVVPRSGKRTYGVFVDDLLAERRLKDAKLDEQLVFLRSILPGCQGEDHFSVLMDAYQYIMKLQKSVDELNTDIQALSANGVALPEEEPAAAQPTSSVPAQLTSSVASSVPTQPTSNSVSTCVPYPPKMEIIRHDGKMEVNVVCMNRPGLLLDIVNGLESWKLCVLHASIACRFNSLIVNLIIETDTLTVLHTGPDRLSAEAEDQNLKDIILGVIRLSTFLIQLQNDCSLEASRWAYLPYLSFKKWWMYGGEMFVSESKLRPQCCLIM